LSKFEHKVREGPPRRGEKKKKGERTKIPPGRNYDKLLPHLNGPVFFEGKKRKEKKNDRREGEKKKKRG